MEEEKNEKQEQELQEEELEQAAGGAKKGKNSPIIFSN